MNNPNNITPEIYQPLATVASINKLYPSIPPSPATASTPNQPPAPTPESTNDRISQTVAPYLHNSIVNQPSLPTTSPLIIPRAQSRDTTIFLDNIHEFSGSKATAPTLDTSSTIPMHELNGNRLLQAFKSILDGEKRTFDRVNYALYLTHIGSPSASESPALQTFNREILACSQRSLRQEDTVIESGSAKILVDSYDEFLDSLLLRLTHSCQYTQDFSHIFHLLKYLPKLDERICNVRLVDKRGFRFDLRFNLSEQARYCFPKASKPFFIKHFPNGVPSKFGQILLTLHKEDKSQKTYSYISLQSKNNFPPPSTAFFSMSLRSCRFPPKKMAELLKNMDPANKQQIGPEFLEALKVYNDIMTCNIEIEAAGEIPEKPIKTSDSIPEPECIYQAQMKFFVDKLPSLCKILDPSFDKNQKSLADVQTVLNDYSKEFTTRIFMHPIWLCFNELLLNLSNNPSFMLPAISSILQDLAGESTILKDNTVVTTVGPVTLANAISQTILHNKYIENPKLKNYSCHTLIFLLKRLYLAKTNDTKLATKEFKELMQSDCTICLEPQGRKESVSFTKKLDGIVNAKKKSTLIFHDNSISTTNINTMNSRLPEPTTQKQTPTELSNDQTDDVLQGLDDILGPLIEEEKSEKLALNQTYASFFEALGKLIFTDNKLLHDALRLQLIQHRGTFACDIDNLRSTHQLDVDKPKNVEVFLRVIKEHEKNSPRNTDQVISLILEHCLGWYGSVLEPTFDQSIYEKWKNDQPLTAKEVISFAKHKTCLPLEKRKGNLTEEEATQVSEAFLQLKWGELTWLIKKGLLGQTVGQPNTSLPCYLVAQNGQNIRLTPFTLHYDSKHYISEMSKGTDAGLELLTQYAKIKSDRFANGSVDITPEEGQALKKAVRQKTFVMLERLEFTLTEEDIKGKTKTSEISEIAADFEEQNSPEDQPEMTANPQQPPEERVIRKKRPVNELDELLPPGSKKRALNNAESQNSKTKKVRDAKESGKYKAIDKEARVISKPKASYNNFTGDIPDFDNPFDSIKANPEDELINNIENLEDYLAAISNRSLNTVCQKAATEAEKIKVLLADKPISYPILKVYKPMDDLSPKAAALNPLLKNYQKNDLDKILHLVKLGLAPLLCYEMGLGKTMVYGSFVLQKIFEGTQGKHVIVVPKSLQKQITDELKVIMTESIFKAWKSLPEVKLSFLNQRLTHALQSSDEIHWDDLILALMMFPKMTEEEFQGKFKHQIKNLDRLQGEFPELQNLAAKHLDKMEGRYKNSQEAMQEILQRRTQLANFDKCATLNLKLQTLSECFAFNPGRDLLSPPLTDNMGIDRLLQVYISNEIYKTSDPKNLQFALHRNNSKIVICTYEHFKILSQIEMIPNGIASLIFDEMQKLQKSKSGISELTSDRIKQIRKENPNLNILGVTGTPLENDFSELWTLLDLVNTDHFPKATFDALRKIADDAKNKLLLKDPQKALVATIRFYGHLKAFREVICNSLVFRRAMKDREIHDDWNGLVPTREDVIVPLQMDAATLQKCNQILANSKKDAGGHLKMGHDLSKIILTPNLENVKQFQLTDENVQALSDKIKTGTDEEFQAIVASSPLIKTLLENPRFSSTVAAKKRFLAFCESLVVGKMVNRAIKRHFGLFRNKSNDRPKQVRFFNGQSKSKNGVSKRDDIISGFKSPGDYFRFLALTFKTGGVGFNLPEADIVLMMERPYNPAKEDQATARALRIGHKNDVLVLWMCPPTFKQDHIECIVDKKRTLFDVLFGHHTDLKEHFQKCLGFLLKDIYNKKLNELKSKSLALEALKPYSDFAERLISNIEEEELAHFVNRVMPVMDLPILPAQAVVQPMVALTPSTVPPLQPPSMPAAIKRPSAPEKTNTTIGTTPQGLKRPHEYNTQEATRSVRKPQDISFSQEGVLLVPPLDLDSAIVLAHGMRELLLAATKDNNIQIENCIKLMRDPEIRQNFLNGSLDPDEQEIIGKILNGRTKRNAEEYKGQCRIAIYEHQNSNYLLKEEKNSSSLVNLRLVRLPNDAGYQVLLKKL